jgi:alpha-ketoglutarate-dependent taurine dioxygenase
VPEVGGDTLWASGYAAYDKLSPAFKKLLDGLK